MERRLVSRSLGEGWLDEVEKMKLWLAGH